MILTTRTFERPSTDVPWHWEFLSTQNEAFIDKFILEYINTGRIITRSVEDFGTKYEVNIVWSDRESMESHYNDEINLVYFSERDAYNQSVGITDTFLVQEV